jgi:ribonuclease BN (tRNA processing enzyme)
MKLHVLGCSSVYPNGGEATSGYVLETATGGLLLECGHEVTAKLFERYRVRDLTAALISHIHPDHFYGVFALGNQLLAAGLRRFPLHLPPGGLKVFHRFAETMGFDFELLADCFEASEYDPDRTLVVNGLNVRMRQTKHPVNTFAMRFGETRGGPHFVFTSDTAWFDGLVEFCRGARLLLTEATDYPPRPESDSAERSHLTPDEAGRLIKEAQVERALLTHYDARYADAVLAAARSTSLHPRISLAVVHEEHSI